MRRLSSALLLVGGLLVLASLYLPWQEASCNSAQCGAGLLGGFVAETQSVDGWSSQVGAATALVALLLAAVAGVALLRPWLATRLPLGLCALLAGYFAFAVAAVARSNAHYRELGSRALHFHYAYGAYLGVAGGIVALLAAAALHRDELVRDRSLSRVAALALVVGL